MPEKLLPAGVSIVDTSEVFGLVPTFILKLRQLNLAKRRDFVRLLLKFMVPVEGEAPRRDTEFLTAVITSKTGNGLFRCKVYSAPEKTRFHGVDYGDELTVSDNYILTHEVSTDQIVKDLQPFLTGVIPEPIPINQEDAKLRAATQHLPPLTPEHGRQYWTRNGTLVTVWTHASRSACISCSGMRAPAVRLVVQNEMCQQTRTFHAWRERERSVWLGGTFRRRGNRMEPQRIACRGNSGFGYREGPTGK